MNETIERDEELRVETTTAEKALRFFGITTEEYEATQTTYTGHRGLPVWAVRRRSGRPNYD